MKVLKNSIRESMYMGWDMFIVSFIFVIDSLFVAKLISGYNIEYKYILMDEVSNYYQTNYLNKVPNTYKTVPQIFIDNKFIGGYSDLEPIINKK